MADPAPTGTVVPAPQGDGSPAPEFKVPDGKVLIDAAEQQTWQRQREQLAAFTKFQGEANKRGFKKPEDFGRIDKFDAWLKAGGMTMEQLMHAKAEDDRATGDTGALDPKSLEAWAKEQGFVRSTDLDKREHLTMARLEHQKAVDAERALVEKTAAELWGENPTEWEKRAMKAAIKDMMEERRGAENGHPLTYPEGHPLSGQVYVPYNEKGLSSVAEELKKLRGLSAGEEMVKAGDAALKGKVSSPAGSSPAKPSKPEKSEGKRPGGMPATADVEAAHKRILASRGGKPVSSLGG